MAKYIDADALFNEAEHLACYDNRDRDAFEDLILSMPAADVKPVKHGEWIEDAHGFFHCSECGFEWDESERTELYCPGCGVRNGRVVIIDEV